MTPQELKSARHSLGLSAEGFAKWVKVSNGRTVRYWEAGERDIPGPVEVLVKATLECQALRDHFGLQLVYNKV